MGTNEFTTKILPLKNNLFRVVFRITGDVEKSEQIVQEALLKVWEDRDSWIVIENLPSYCMMVARNLALREDVYKRQVVRRGAENRSRQLFNKNTWLC